MGVEQVVRLVSAPLARQADHVHQHLRESIAGIGPVHAALGLEVEEQAAIADEDRDPPHRPLALEGADRRDLSEARPILVLQHHAGGVLRDDPADHGGRHHHGEGERVILKHEGNIRPYRLGSMSKIACDLIVRAQRVGGRDHHPGGAHFHHLPGEGAHRREARRGDSDDDGEPGLADHAFRDRGTLRMVELSRLAELAQDRQPIDLRAFEERHHPAEGDLVDPPVRVERRRCDRHDAADVAGEGHLDPRLAGGGEGFSRWLA